MRDDCCEKDRGLLSIDHPFQNRCEANAELERVEREEIKGLQPIVNLKAQADQAGKILEWKRQELSN